MANVLDVYLGEDSVGSLEQVDQGRLVFTYSQSWLTNSISIPISLSLPLQKEPFDDQSTRVWFANLLPEGRIREAIAKRYSVNARNEFAMLEAIGHDCAGAISIWPRSEYEARESKRELITESKLAKLIKERKLPLLIAGENEVRLSLAGAQEKLALIYEDNQFYLTKEGAASTHILKPAIVDIEESVENEVFCMQLASACELATPSVNVFNLDKSVKVALIKRFDRKRQGNNVIRIHQEDFCQALGIPPDYKYQGEGGPDLVSCARAIRKWSIKPGYDLKIFIDWVIFNVFIGNCDAHAKNISFLFTHNGPVLSPFYDLMCTRVYDGLSDKLAMKIGGEDRINWLQERHWERFANEVEVKPKLIFERIKNMSNKILSESENISTTFENSKIVADIIKFIKNVSKNI